METINFTGKKVKIKSNSGGHGALVGSFATVTSHTNNNQIRLKEYPSWVFYLTELELVPVTAEQINKEISELNSTIDDLKLKKQFMKENGLEEFDETQYKVFKTLSTLENKELSALEKSKLIAQLIDNK